MREIWKPIDGFLGFYEVSNFGRVKRVEHCSQYKSERGKVQHIKERIKVLGKDKDGYSTVMLYKGSERKLYKVHRLVAAAFVPNPKGYDQINHKDEQRDNNFADNLEWCDCKYNNNYGSRNKKISESKKGCLCHSIRDKKTGRFIKRGGIT